MIKVSKEFDSERYGQWALDNIFKKVTKGKYNKDLDTIFIKLKKQIQKAKGLNRELREYLLIDLNLEKLLVGKPQDIVQIDLLNKPANLKKKIFKTYFVKTVYCTKPHILDNRFYSNYFLTRILNFVYLHLCLEVLP